MLRKTGFSLWPQANDDIYQKEPSSQSNTNMYNSPNDLLKFSCKIAGLQRQLLKKWQNCHLVLVKSICQISAKLNFSAKYAQGIAMKSAIFYQSFFSKICPENFGKFPAKQTFLLLIWIWKTSENFSYICFNNLSESLELNRDWSCSYLGIRLGLPWNWHY